MSFKNISISQLQEYVIKGHGVTFPGGYPLYGVTADCGALCPNCIKKEWPLITSAIFDSGTDKQWEVVAVEVNYENEIHCDNCNKAIDSAYEV